MAAPISVSNHASIEFVASDHLRTVNSMIAESGRLDAAVAFWGSGAVKALDLRKVQGGATFVCNLYSLGCNPHEVQKLFNLKRFNIRHHGGLHAKMYLTESAVCIGSSNASDPGLGFSKSAPSMQREVNVVCREKRIVDQARQWLEKIVEESKEIKQVDLDRAKRNYKPLLPNACELIDLPVELLKACKLAVLVWAIEPDQTSLEKALEDETYSLIDGAGPFFDTKPNAARYPYGFHTVMYQASADRRRIMKYDGIFDFLPQKKWKTVDGFQVIWSFKKRPQRKVWQLPGLPPVLVGLRSQEMISKRVEKRKIRLGNDLGHIHEDIDGFVTWEALYDLLS